MKNSSRPGLSCDRRVESSSLRSATPGVVALVTAALLLSNLACSTRATTSVADNEMEQLERFLYSVVNSHRLQVGLNELEWDESIALVCRKHCRDMADGIEGVGHGGMDFRILMVDAMHDFICFHENVSSIGGRPHPASYAYMGWRSSSTHRKNMECAATRTGVGAWRSEDGVYYFVQIYIRESAFGNQSLSLFD